MRRVCVRAHEMRQAVLQASSESRPLGAYAYGDLVRYLFLDAHGIREIETTLGDGDEVFSCTAQWPLFERDEREMRDRQDIAFAEESPSDPHVEGRGLMTTVVGPVHAGIIEPGRFIFQNAGETIVYLAAQFGFSTRDIEDRLTGRDAHDAASSIARVCGACSVARSWSYARALEAIAGMEVARPHDLVRLVLAELERLYNHLFDLASTSAGAGYGAAQIEGLRLKERVHRLCARHAGHRFLFDTVVPGGVREGLLDDAEGLRAEIPGLRDAIRRFEVMLLTSESTVRRFSGAGIVTSEVADAFGAVGPALRASGGSADARALVRYGAYASYTPHVMTVHEGDVLARIRVKFGEALEALRLIEAALDELAGTRVRAPAEAPRVSGHAIGVCEGARGSETVAVDLADGALERIHIISASFRNWPIVIRAMEDNIVPDFPLVNKSFNLCYACADR